MTYKHVVNAAIEDSGSRWKQRTSRCSAVVPAAHCFSRKRPLIGTVVKVVLVFLMIGVFAVAYWV